MVNPKCVQPSARWQLLYWHVGRQYIQQGRVCRAITRAAPPARAGRARLFAPRKPLRATRRARAAKHRGIGTAHGLANKQAEGLLIHKLTTANIYTWLETRQMLVALPPRCTASVAVGTCAMASSARPYQAAQHVYRYTKIIITIVTMLA